MITGRFVPAAPPGVRVLATHVLAITVLAIAVMIVLPTRAAAQDGPGQDEGVPPVRVQLTDVDAVIDPTAADDEPPVIHAEILLRAGPVAREDLRVVTTAYARVEDVDGLRSAYAGDLPPVFSAVAEPLADMPAGTSRVVDLVVDAADLALLGRSRAGVYPLTVEVFAGSDPVGLVTTAAVVLPEQRPQPLPATTLVRVRSDAAPLRGDTADPSLVDLLDPGSSLAQLVDDLEATTSDGSAAGLVLAVDGRLVADLAGMADGAIAADGAEIPPTARLSRRAAAALEVLSATARRGDTEVVAHPYGPADLVALVRAGLDVMARELLAAGPAVAADLLGTPVTTSTVLPPDGLDAATLAAIGPAGAEAVVLDEAYLSFAETEQLHPVRRLRTADGGEVRVLVPDAGLSDLTRDLAGRGTPSVVQQVLAETALAWLAETPDRSAGVLLALDPLADPPDGRTVVSAITDAIAEAPWLRPVDLSQLRAAVDPSTRLVRLAYPPRAAARELPSGYTAVLVDAVAAMGPLSALLPDGSPAPDRYAASLQRAASTAYRDPGLQPQGLDRALQVTQRLAALTDGVAIPETPPITLTSTTGEVPVVVVNQSDSALRLRASVDSARFAFPGGATRTFTLDPRSSTRLIFTAQALNPGGFAPIRVQVDDGAGVVLARQQLSVRSTAFPIVGLLATVGSVVVLVAWGLRQGLRRRRPGRARHEDRSDAA